MDNKIFFSLPLNTWEETLCSPDCSSIKEKQYIRIAMPTEVAVYSDTFFSDLYHETRLIIPLCIVFKLNPRVRDSNIYFVVHNRDSNVMYEGPLTSKAPSAENSPHEKACANAGTINLAYYVDLPVQSACYLVTAIHGEVRSNSLQCKVQYYHKAAPFPL